MTSAEIRIDVLAGDNPALCDLAALVRAYFVAREAHRSMDPFTSPVDDLIDVAEVVHNAEDALRFAAVADDVGTPTPEDWKARTLARIDASGGWWRIWRRITWWRR